MSVVGWDIGGAHLKAARVRDGRVEAVVQAATPLWLGLGSLEAAFDALGAELGRPDRHVITMTGELCDAFPSRREGVAGLAAIAANHLAPAALSLYAGRAGFVELGEAASHAADIASANWHASAALVALELRDALFIDIGSTTADLIPIVGGRIAAVGYTDAERLASGELLYTGMARSFVMALGSRAPFRGAWTPLMNEYFASSADVHRILGDLPEGADKMQTADGREKTVEASRARLARMIGREADEGAASEWEGLAAWFAEAQIRQIADAASLRLSRNDVAGSAPVVAAGVGERVAAEVARRLRRPHIGFSSLIAGPAEASHCAPAVAVALLGAERASAPAESRVIASNRGAPKENRTCA
ncbi:MAG TPA: hydantoinase/oxoprolinase family protein [Roseiarcus sp.]|nr:hydantoinase/oxoprolinase family protein [Roseiarcus sp.]